MDTLTLEQLFLKLTERYGVLPAEAKQIFSILIDVTLKYRDALVTQKEPPLTVEDTQQALDELLYVFQAGKLSPNLPKRIHTLLNLWLEEIKVHTYH